MRQNALSQLALSALMILGAASAPAFAETPAAPGAINFAMLHLTPDQVKQINLIRLPYSKLAIKLKYDIQMKQLQIQEQLVQPAVNPNVVRQLMSEKIAMQSQLQKLSLEQFLAFKKLLTPDQVALLSGAMNVR